MKTLIQITKLVIALHLMNVLFSEIASAAELEYTNCHPNTGCISDIIMTGSIKKLRMELDDIRDESVDRDDQRVESRDLWFEMWSCENEIDEANEECNTYTWKIK